MLMAIADNHCTAKADAHIALCYKFAQCIGFEEWEIEQYYEQANDEGHVNRFDAFREYTRAVTDYIDEVLDWDMSKGSISDHLAFTLSIHFLILADKFILQPRHMPMIVLS